jgi:protein-L-isoaspartate(D-aspartate) O-methyltransferase
MSLSRRLIVPLVLLAGLAAACRQASGLPGQTERQAAQQQRDSYQEARERMVRNQIEARGVEHARVLEAMRRVPRHLFVSLELADLAYQDTPLPIEESQTISQPYIVALMTELARPDKDHTVLEIGTGSGYQAAVLSLVVKQVYSVELVPLLARTAAERLKVLGYHNVEVRQGDGYKGWAEHAPYDAILVTAAPEEIPQELVRQLKPGGRMVIPTGPLGDQDLQVVEKDARGKVSVRSVLPVRFVPLVKPK